MHPMRQRYSNALDIQKKKRSRSKAKTLTDGQDAYNFAGSPGFKILIRDVEEEMNKLRDKMFDNETKVESMEGLRIEGQCWNKILGKLNGYLIKRKVSHIKQELEANESNL